MSFTLGSISESYATAICKNQILIKILMSIRKVIMSDNNFRILFLASKFLNSVIMVVATEMM